MGCNSSSSKEDSPTLPTKTNHTPAIAFRELTPEFKEYWFSGQAEVTSYHLQQERYGEMREGTAVTIFVTEEFLREAQVKSDHSNEKNVLAMKLNTLKNYNTGIYPYSIMTSTFSPVKSTDHPLKISNSVQEWCGQVYMQLNNKKVFEIQSHSYFEGEADRSLELAKTYLEDEIWNLIRLNPEELPTGDISIIPSFEYIRLNHIEIRAHNAYANLKQGDSVTIYTLHYPDLQRQLKLFFRNRFPYEIEKWEEVNASKQNDTLRLLTTGSIIKRMKIDYWNKNQNEFAPLRDSLGLK